MAFWYEYANLADSEDEGLAPDGPPQAPELASSSLPALLIHMAGDVVVNIEIWRNSIEGWIDLPKVLWNVSIQGIFWDDNEF